MKETQNSMVGPCLVNGLSLRDYFAVRAMEALIPECVALKDSNRLIPGAAYEIADGMMAAREAKK